MISIDYRIERDEGNETVIYEPKLLPKRYENISYIKGPNSSGKSTLLNLIAVGFYGKDLSSNELENSLRKKILSLLDTEHQKISFEINIDNPKLGWTLISKKDNLNTSDISVKLLQNGKVRQLSSELFFKEFRLIYDIPYNPLERLPQLLQDINSAQNAIGRKIGVFKDKLNELIIEIRNSKDPEKIEELENEVINYSKERNKLEHEINVLQRFYNKLLKYYLVRFLIENDRKVREQSTVLRNLEEELKEAEKEGRKNAREQTKIEAQIERETNKAIELYHDADFILNRLLSNNQKEHLKLWKEANIEKEINYSDIYTTIRDQTNYFINNFRTGLDYELQAYSNDLDTIEVYKKLLATLADIRYDNVTLPGINQTVEIFKQKIIEELEKHDDLLKKLNNFQDCIDNLTDFRNALNSVIKTVEEYKKMPKSNEIINGRDVNTIINQIKVTKNLKSKFDSHTENYRSVLIKNKFDPTLAARQFYDLSHDNEIKPYESMNESSIVEALSKYKDSLSKKMQQLTKYEELINSKNRDLIILQEREPHKYRQNLHGLEELFNNVQLLEKIFVQQYSKFINDIIKHKNSADNLQKRYSKLLGNLLAKKIDVIKHVDKEFRVTNLDLHSNVISTEEGKLIKFEDLGTGHSQAAFMQAKLAMKDDRKIIALFDEVAMMDEKTLEPIKEKLVQLYNDERLFMALIVQKSDSVEVEGLT